jgi:hypothetical protein
MSSPDTQPRQGELHPDGRAELMLKLSRKDFTNSSTSSMQRTTALSSSEETDVGIVH